MRILLLLMAPHLLLTGLVARATIPPELKKELLAFMNTMNQAALTCRAELAPVDSPEAMAATLNRYIRAVEPATRRLQAVKQSYKAFFEAAEQEPGQGLDDPELEQASKKLEETMTGMAPVMARTTSWLSHPQVREALERLEVLMGGVEGEDSESGTDGEE